MRRGAIAVFAVMLLAACEREPFVCAGAPEDPRPTADDVCAHLVAIECFVEDDPETAGFEDPSCEAGYQQVSDQVSPDELERVLRCYMAAETCAQVEGCNRACGAEGGAIAFDPDDVGSRRDASVPDAAIDGGAQDAGRDGDSGADASAPADAAIDGGAPDDAGLPDASLPDASLPDAGPPDAGPPS